MEERLKDILEEIEEQAALKKQSIFRSTLNQPNLVAISSANAVGQGSASAFSKFNVNLPRPVLEAETLELLNANIPQCNPNIPDTACAFWYYRLNQYSGDVPSLNNLCCVRLLPSYYRKEFIVDPNNYGYNVTFGSYDDVSTQLALACSTDLGYVNYMDTPTIFPYFKSQFSPSDVNVYYDSAINKFRVNCLNTTSTPAYLLWNNATAYNVGDRVYFDGPLTIPISYTCTIANTNKQPNVPANSSFWVPDNQSWIRPWAALTTYGPGRIVSYNGVLYRARVVTTGDQPDTSPAEWNDDFEDAEFTWNRYLITGYDDPNVAIAQGRFFRPYDDYTLFEENDVVEYQGQFYIADDQIYGVNPTNAVVWSPQSISINSLSGNGTTITIQCDNSAGLIAGGDVVYIANTQNFIFNSINNTDPSNPLTQYTIATASPTQLTITNVKSGVSFGGVISLSLPPTMGLNAFSNQYDMNLLNHGVPIGIPGQPFNPKPRRLLNSILGFTWNGIFTASLLEDIIPDTINIIPTTTTDLYNRLRPVPFYFVEPVALSVAFGDIPATNATIYTAEGYANLVYSSIISIYTSIVGGSTLNTEENTNLLAMGTMNCGNLGISFFSPFINNPLLVNGGDLYNIMIELKDEFDEPYVLTNNAVATFVFKITYKKDQQK